LQRIFYIYRVIVKVLFFLNFGIGSTIFSLLFFPVLFFKYRRLVSIAFALFVLQMRLFGILTLKIENRAFLKNLYSKIIVANHPSLLDIVLLISLLPNADCIVNSSLGKRNILRIIVNTIYISNDLDFKEISSRVANSLSKGNCVIIFPEGTRSVPGKPIDLKKGAARLAIGTGYDIVPIHIGGNEKIGLRKHDALFSFHSTQRYNYVFDILPPISIDEYKQMPSGMASKLLTEKIKEQIFPIGKIPKTAACEKAFDNSAAEIFTKIRDRIGEACK